MRCPVLCSWACDCGCCPVVAGGSGWHPEGERASLTRQPPLQTWHQLVKFADYDQIFDLNDNRRIRAPFRQRRGEQRVICLSGFDKRSPIYFPPQTLKKKTALSKSPPVLRVLGVTSIIWNPDLNHDVSLSELSPWNVYLKTNLQSLHQEVQTCSLWQ